MAYKSEHTMTIGAAAKLLGISVQTMRLRAQYGKLPYTEAIISASGKRYEYIVYIQKFEEHTGIKVPQTMKYECA